jgi:hypothetical protein
MSQTPNGEPSCRARIRYAGGPWISGARGKGLSLSHEGTEYAFCGKGYLLEFRDDPAQYLDPVYTPSM